MLQDRPNEGRFGMAKEYPVEIAPSGNIPHTLQPFCDIFTSSSQKSTQNSAQNLVLTSPTTMSREAYAPPTLQPSSSNFNTTTTTDIAGPSTPYDCGECNAKVLLKKGDPIRCKDCGHRVLYKQRTKRYIWLLLY